MFEDGRGIQFITSDDPPNVNPIVIRDETIDYTKYDMISALHDEDSDITAITIHYGNGFSERYTAAYFDLDEEESEELDPSEEFVADLVEGITQVIDSFVGLAQNFIRSRQ